MYNKSGGFVLILNDKFLLRHIVVAWGGQAVFHNTRTNRLRLVSYIFIYCVICCIILNIKISSADQADIMRWWQRLNKTRFGPLLETQVVTSKHLHRTKCHVILSRIKQRKSPGSADVKIK